VYLHFTRTGLSMPTPACVMVEKVSEYILAYTGPRQLDGRPWAHGGLWVRVGSLLFYGRP